MLKTERRKEGLFSYRGWPVHRLANLRVAFYLIALRDACAPETKIRRCQRWRHNGPERQCRNLTIYLVKIPVEDFGSDGQDAGIFAIVRPIYAPFVCRFRGNDNEDRGSACMEVIRSLCKGGSAGPNPTFLIRKISCVIRLRRSVHQMCTSR